MLAKENGEVVLKVIFLVGVLSFYNIKILSRHTW
jgi:hypothetical protein